MPCHVIILHLHLHYGWCDNFLTTRRMSLSSPNRRLSSPPTGKYVVSEGESLYLKNRKLTGIIPVMSLNNSYYLFYGCTAIFFPFSFQNLYSIVPPRSRISE